MVSNEMTSIQEVIQYLFNNDAYVVDNQNMSLTLYVPPSIDITRIKLIQKLNLLPKPQAVNYNIVIKARINQTFGFKTNSSAVGFNDKFSPKKGYFAEKIIND